MRLPCLRPRKRLKNFIPYILEKLPENISLNQVDIWFQDESRVGQQGSTTRIWAPKGTRPRAIKQQQFKYAYIYGAVCPSLQQAIGLVLPLANSAGMAAPLEVIAR